ncbi:MAG: tRNA 2-thiouridine(34) synthase MnmA [Candidatus Glassbacteria bacterium]|nr:tRNA 2-thiouridine(34) synthase MnmA [Candidatus Glassbacteria bacterium]
MTVPHAGIEYGMNTRIKDGATIAVAMSGGVDSSVAAALLAERGFHVIGLTMRLFCYAEKPSSEKSCCNTQSIADARAVCDRIGAPHYVIGSEKEFRSDVIQRFVDSYLSGSTPNPCVDCNTFIKFKFLLHRAMSLGADYLATGHYVRLGERDGSPCLLRGLDPDKDQSYFLWGIHRAALDKLVFPLGEFRKPEVRELAGKYGLAVREKTESQEICFVENDSVEDFIRNYSAGGEIEPGYPASTVPGPVVDRSGQVVGEHRGSAFYTIGQRKGLGVSLGRPVYITRIDTVRNEIEIGEGEDLGSSSFSAAQVNYLADPPPGKSYRAEIQIRYRHTPAAGMVTAAGKYSVRVETERPQRAVTRGQSVVFYDGDLVLGGGVISETESRK